MLEICWCIDIQIQNFLVQCLQAPTIAHVKGDRLSFQQIQDNIVTQTFSMPLPHVISSTLSNSPLKRDFSNASNNNYQDQTDPLNTSHKIKEWGLSRNEWWQDFNGKKDQLDAHVDGVKACPRFQI